MTDYIERDELVSYFKEIATKTLRDGSVQCVLGAGVIAHMIVEIKEFPAADVRPVVRGEWVNRGYESGWVGLCDCYRCTACNTTWDAKSHFCPNCGADMREDEA